MSCGGIAVTKLGPDQLAKSKYEQTHLKIRHLWVMHGLVLSM